jgi:hypothetical protein
VAVGFDNRVPTDLANNSGDIFHEGESSGGQFQNRNDMLPNPKGGLHCHSVIGRFFRHFEQETRAGPDSSSHSPTALPIASPKEPSNGSMSAPQAGQVNPSHEGPSAH